MKNLIILIFLFQVSFISCQTEKRLYLLFEKEKEKMYIHEEGLNPDNVFKIYTYKIKIRGEFKEIYFDSETSEEKGIYQEKKGKYKTKLRQKIIHLPELKKHAIKDYKWLKKKMSSFTNFQALYQFYGKIYIIQIDSANKKAIVTEVDNVEILE